MQRLKERLYYEKNHIKSQESIAYQRSINQITRSNPSSIYLHNLQCNTSSNYSIVQCNYRFFHKIWFNRQIMQVFNRFSSITVHNTDIIISFDVSLLFTNILITETLRHSQGTPQHSRRYLKINTIMKEIYLLYTPGPVLQANKRSTNGITTLTGNC